MAFENSPVFNALDPSGGISGAANDPTAQANAKRYQEVAAKYAGVPEPQRSQMIGAELGLGISTKDVSDGMRDVGEALVNPGATAARQAGAARDKYMRPIEANTPGMAGINADYGMATNRGFNRQNPTMDPTQQNQARASQWDLVQQLQAQARGEGPSLAQMQLRSAADQNIAQAMALGASQRGMGGAGMMKGIQNQQAGIAGKLGGDSAMLRLQEQMAAQQMLGGTLQGLRGQDIGFQQADVASRLQGNALNDQLLMNALNGRAGFATNMGNQRLQADMFNQENARQWEGLVRGAQQNAGPGILPNLLQAGGGMFTQLATMGSGMPMGGGAAPGGFQPWKLPNPGGPGGL